MQSIDSEVISFALKCQKEHKEVYLCTIVSTKGASTRPLGSLFAYSDEKSVGYISKPRLDDIFIKLLKDGNFQDEISFFSYGNHLLDLNCDLSLPCCGSVKLLIEKLAPTQKNIEIFTKYHNLIEKREPFCKVLDTKTFEINFTQEIVKNEQNIVIDHFPILQVLLIGASTNSIYLSRLCKQMGYSVKICENREAILNSSSSDDFFYDMPSNKFVKEFCDKYSVVLALAHDPNIDDLAIIEALNIENLFIGAIGSDKNNKKREKRLLDFGIEEKQIAKIKAPIGLEIGSNTPDEIAISILAQIISYKNSLG